jgi:hypothetical protein
VEADIFKRLASTPAAQTIPGQAPPSFGQTGATQAPGLKKQTSTSSFLDEWLAKRKATTQSPVSPSSTAPALVAAAVTPKEENLVAQSPQAPVKEVGLFEQDETVHLNNPADQSQSPKDTI